MKAFTTKAFEKQYKKLPQKVQNRFKGRLRLFGVDPRNRSLNLHTVTIRGDRFISMNVTGDCRALFLWEDENTVIFHKIGTHSQLYG